MPRPSRSRSPSPRCRAASAASRTSSGIKLVDRGPRGAELTTAGNRLLSYARIIDANLTSAENELRGLRDRSSRTEQIAFGMSWLTEALIAAQLIERVLRKRPGIRLTTIVGDFESLAPKLASGRLEFFVGPPPIGGRASRHHDASRSRSFRPPSSCAPAHPLAEQKGAHGPATSSRRNGYCPSPARFRASPTTTASCGAASLRPSLCSRCSRCRPSFGSYCATRIS